MTIHNKNSLEGHQNLTIFKTIQATTTNLIAKLKVDHLLEKNWKRI